MKSKSLPLFVGGVLMVASTGCKSIGPQTVARDRFDYSSAITESWKRQTLLNIVKMRYLDPPIFVDVGQIVAGYSIETTASAGLTLPETDGLGGTTGALGIQGKFTDRPTITYTPMTGNKFVKGLMTPIPPDSLFFTIQSGWPADGIMLAAAASVNGLRNQESTPDGVSAPDEDFIKAIQLFRKIQLSGAVGMRVMQESEKRQSTIITFRTRDIKPETLEDVAELRRLLHLDPDAKEFRLIFGATQSDSKDIAMLTRSMLHIMQTMASQVDVPPEHVAEGRTNPGWKATGTDMDRTRLISIHSSKAKPDDAFVAVEYRKHWFWIDDRDLKSKRTFAFTMMLFTLADTGERDPMPLITIPAQ